MQICRRCNKKKSYEQFWNGKSKHLLQTCKACRYKWKNDRKKAARRGEKLKPRSRNPVVVRQMTVEERQKAFG